MKNKICEIEEITMIYCDRNRMGTIIEECERSEFIVRNTSKFGVGGGTGDDRLSLLSRGQRLILTIEF